MFPPIAVIITDVERQILWVNEDFTKITGYSFGEVKGRKPSLLQGPESEPEAILRIRSALEQQKPFKDQIINYRKNGEKYLCKLAVHPIFDAQKNLVNFIAFEVDGNKVKDDAYLSLLQLENNAKYHSSRLKGMEETQLFSQVEALLVQDRLFLNPGLNLKMLADKLKTNTKYLSQVINHFAQKNFQQFVNSFRVQEAKRLIDKELHRELTLFGIGLQSGFRNKSTFYKVFKKQTGLTPREYADLKANNGLYS